MRRYEEGQEVVSGVKIISHIGAGGFGTVYKVSVPGGVEKALKIINLQGTQGVKEYNALKLIKKISHPNLVSIDSYWLRDLQGKLIDFSSDDSINAEKQSLELIILMGLGRMSLHDLLMQYLNQGKPGIPFDELIRLMSATAEAIDYLNEPHNLGLKEPVAIQHGDIKPGNILLVGNSVQVCDYGLAKAITTSKGVRTSVALFSPGYCSPEMNRNQPSYWSDQFSLAISYYELRTGKLPFNEEEEINAGIVAALGKLDFTGVPKAEREVLLKATNPITNQRYPKCMDLINALRATANSSARDSGPKPRSLEEVLQPDSDIVPGYKLVQRISHGERDEFWKATTSAGKPFIIYVIREFRGALGNQLLQSLEFLRQLDEHENLINLRNSWMIHSDGRVMPYIDTGSLENQTVALVSLLDNVDCTLEDYYNECLKKRASQGIPDHELLQFMMQASKAVDYLTQLGHSEYLDLKPQTILLTKNKTVKLGIAGLAKRLMSGSSALTTDRLVNAFAPPELFDFEVGKHWNSNQYSLALTYYWLRSLGHLPFPPDSSPKLIREYHLNGQLDFSDVPEREQNILYNATVLDPNQRFSSCFEFVDAMQVAMGVSVPQYAAPLPHQKISPRPTPMRVEQSTPVRPHIEERPTDHVKREQQITPPILPKQKTPQTPAARRSDPYSTINSMPALPQGFGYDETTELPAYSEAVHHPAGLFQPTSVTEPPDAIEENEEPEQDFRAVFRQTNVDKKRKRRRSAMVLTVGGLIISVVGAAALWKFVLDKSGPLASNSSSNIEPTVPLPNKGTQPTRPTPAQLAKQIEDLVEKKDYATAWEQITQAKQDATWVKEQQGKVRTGLASKLKSDLQTLVNNKEYEKAEKTVSDQASKYKEMLPHTWEKDQLAFIGSNKPTIPTSTWPGKWVAIKGQLKALDNLQLLSEYQNKLKAVAAEAPDEEVTGKQEAKELLGSVNGLIELRQTPHKNDPGSLLNRLKKFTEWKQKANLELQSAGCATEVPREIVKEAKECFLKVDTKESLLQYAPLLEMLRTEVDKENLEWITAGRLEIAAQNTSTMPNAIKQLAEAYSPQSPIGHFAKAACLSQEMNSEALKRWHKVYPEKGSWDPVLMAQFRMQLADKLVNEILASTRSNATKRGAFRVDQRHLALESIRVIVRLQSQIKPEKNDENIIAEKMLLEDEENSNDKGQNLRNYGSSKVFSNVDKELQDLITKRIDKYGLPDNATTKERVAFTRRHVTRFLNPVSSENALTCTQLQSRVIIPFITHLEKHDIASLGQTDRDEVASIFADLGEDLAMDPKEWITVFDSNQKVVAQSLVLLQKAVDYAPSNLMIVSKYGVACFNNNIDNSKFDFDIIALQAINSQGSEFIVHLLMAFSTTKKFESVSKPVASNTSYIKLLADSDTSFTNAWNLIKDDSRYSKRYKTFIAIGRSNILVRKANIAKTPEEVRNLLDTASGLVTNAVALCEYDHELLADMNGIILEDQALLLGLNKYEEAVRQFQKALKGSEGDLRTRALLHKGRCNFRWGLFVEETDPVLSKKLWKSSVEDMNVFLKDKKNQMALDQIEGHYFRGCASLQLAIRTFADDQVESNEYFNSGCADMTKALDIANNAKIVQFNNNIFISYSDKIFQYFTLCRSLKRGNFSVEQEPFKDMLQKIRSLRDMFSNSKPYANYCNVRIKLLEANQANIQNQLSGFIDDCDKAIESSMNTEDNQIRCHILDIRYQLNKLNNDLIAMLRDSKTRYDLAVSESQSDDIKSKWLFLTASSSIRLYYNDSDAKNWENAMNMLNKLISNYAIVITSTKKKEETQENIIKEYQYLFQKPPKAEDRQKLLDKLKKIEQSDPATIGKPAVALAKSVLSELQANK